MQVFRNSTPISGMLIFSPNSHSVNSKEFGWCFFFGLTGRFVHVPVLKPSCWCLAEDMLRQYCGKVGIQFEDAMLNWENTPNMQVFQDWMPWFEGVLTSKVILLCGRIHGKTEPKRLVHHSVRRGQLLCSKHFWSEKRK